MIIKLFGRCYRISEQRMVPAQNAVMSFLEKIKELDKDKVGRGFYTAVIVQMYLCSSAVLKTLNVSDLRKAFPELRETADTELMGGTDDKSRN